MPPTLALTAPPGGPHRAQQMGHRACLAVYAGPLDPPRVEDFADSDEAALIEALFTRAAVYQLTAASSTPHCVEDLVITGGNSFRYTLPAMSVTSLVLRP